MAKLQLTSPWINYYHEVQAFFKYDRDVRVVLDEESAGGYEVRLYVNGDEKAEALRKLLPESRDFGNVTMRVAVILGNDNKTSRYRPRFRGAYRLPSSEIEETFCTAFANNAAFAFSETVSGILTNDIIYVVFANEVVQYYNDDLGDYFGHCSTLFQNIAADIFKPFEGVHYCTDKVRYDRCED